MKYIHQDQYRHPKVEITLGTQFDAENLAALIVSASKPSKRTRHEPRKDASAELESALKKAEGLNARTRWPRFVDRVTRKQGQINRLLARSAECLVEILRGSRFDEVSERRLDAALASIELSRQLHHSSRGHPWIRRIMRPQGRLNVSLAQALSEVEESLRAELASRDLVDDTAMANLEHLRWHAKEIVHLSGMRASCPKWLRRVRRDQFGINHYLIVALRYARLLSIHF